MSTELLLRGLFCGITSLIIAYRVFSRYDAEIGMETDDEGKQKYFPEISGALLPLFLLIVIVLSIFLFGADGAVKMTLSLCFGIFLHISVYYLLLMLFLPFFRRRISARACALLWMLPNYLYIIDRDFMELPEPKFILRAPGNTAYILFFLWLAGFTVVFLWKITEHLKFRRKVLLDAYEITDPQVLEIWNNVIADARIKKPKFKLVSSPNVTSPLSIGLFQRTIRVILPKKAYSSEDLELILRHEIIHVAREDSWSKFFLMFCTAMCWFNPLMWIAMRKSANDLELSCDETVLLNADELTRKQYAALLLNTASDERGFTTCLATTAKSLRYRLKNIVKPKKRSSGAIAVGLIFFLLCMSCGYVSLAYGGKRGAEVIYQNRGYEDCHIGHISSSDYNVSDGHEIVNEAAFHEYLSGLTFLEMTGNYSFDDMEKEVFYFLDTPEETLVVRLYDSMMELTHMGGNGMDTEQYFIEEGTDWDYIDSIIKAYPSLNIDFIGLEDSSKEDFSARLDKLWKTTDWQRDLIYDSDYPEQENDTGIFGYDPFDQASFTFTKELAAPCSVKIETWDRKNSYTVTQEDISEPFVIDLPDYAAHYQIYASFIDPDGSIYEAEFRFDIGDL